MQGRQMDQSSNALGVLCAVQMPDRCAGHTPHRGKAYKKSHSRTHHPGTRSKQHWRQHARDVQQEKTVGMQVCIPRGRLVTMKKW